MGVVLELIEGAVFVLIVVVAVVVMVMVVVEFIKENSLVGVVSSEHVFIVIQVTTAHLQFFHGIIRE